MHVYNVCMVKVFALPWQLLLKMIFLIIYHQMCISFHLPFPPDVMKIKSSVYK